MGLRAWRSLVRCNWNRCRAEIGFLRCSDSNPVTSPLYLGWSCGVNLGGDLGEALHSCCHLSMEMFGRFQSFPFVLQFGRFQSLPSIQRPGARAGLRALSSVHTLVGETNPRLCIRATHTCILICLYFHVSLCLLEPQRHVCKSVWAGRY